MSALAEIARDAYEQGVDVHDLTADERRRLVLDALARIEGARAARAAAEGPYHVEGRFIRDYDLAQRQKRIAAELRADTERRRREYFTRHPDALAELRELMDAEAAQDWNEVEAA